MEHRHTTSTNRLNIRCCEVHGFQKAGLPKSFLFLSTWHRDPAWSVFFNPPLSHVQYEHACTSYFLLTPSSFSVFEFVKLCFWWRMKLRGRKCSAIITLFFLLLSITRPLPINFPFRSHHYMHREDYSRRYETQQDSTLFSFLSCVIDRFSSAIKVSPRLPFSHSLLQSSGAFISLYRGLWSDGLCMRALILIANT